MMKSRSNQSESSPNQYLRIRQLGWDPELLSKANVLVVGAGALGNEVLKNLALLGVGQIVVVDMDQIEDHNLTRSVLFRRDDVGKAKAVVAAQRVQEINHAVRVQPLVGRVQDALGLGAFRRFDVVLGCLDNAQARYDVGRACWQTNTLFIDAGLDHLNGDVRVFQPPDTPCYSCTLTDEDRLQMGNRHRCLQIPIDEERLTIPTAPTISGIAAGWQTQIAIKYLHGAPIPAGKRLGLYGLYDESFSYTITPNPDCARRGLHALISPDEIIPTDFSVKSCSAAELIQLARRQVESYGEHSVVDLGFDLVKFAQCGNCGKRIEFCRRKDHIYIDEVTCCNAIMNLDEKYMISERDPLSRVPLTDLGVPPLDLVLVKYTHDLNESTWVYRYFDMGGDQTEVFGGPRAVASKVKASRRDGEYREAI